MTTHHYHVIAGFPGCLPESFDSVDGSAELARALITDLTANWLEGDSSLFVAADGPDFCLLEHRDLGSQVVIELIDAVDCDRDCYDTTF